MLRQITTVGMLARCALAFFAAVIAGLGPASPAAAHGPGVVLSSFGTATVDGVLAPGEWDRASRLPLTLSLAGGGTMPATLFAMNDGANLYVAVQFAQPSNTQRQETVLFFDLFRNHERFDNPGDDSLLFSPGFLGFVDQFRTSEQCPPGGFCVKPDRDVGGRTDGAAVFSDAGGMFTYELSHPLDSGDFARDLVMRPGETVGFQLSLLIKGALTVFPSPTTLGFGDLVIAAPTNALVVPSASQVRSGDVLAVTLRAQNESGNPELDLYAGVLMADGQTLLFFTQPGVIGAQATLTNPAASVPLLSLTGGSATIPFELFRITVPQSVPPGAYYFFAALVRRGALADSQIDTDDIVTLDVRPVTLAP